MHELPLCKPDWLKIRMRRPDRFGRVRELLARYELNTVCTSAKCPNMFECWDDGCLTFMVLGDTCTRACRFCAVSHGCPEGVDDAEPGRVALAAEELGLKYVVITSVDRDDLSDFGASHYAACVRAVKGRLPGVGVEVIIPDFSGELDLIEAVVDAGPDVISHNVETVERLSSLVRDRRAGYFRSLDVLRDVKRLDPLMVTKSSLLLGMGEDQGEVRGVMHDLCEARVDILTVGQYLRPGPDQWPVCRYVHPDEFAELAAYGRSLGFGHVEAGPLVRTSYRAAGHFLSVGSQVIRRASCG